MANLLYIVLLCLVTLLIVLIEGVVLTWLKWAGFGQSLVSALVANLLSTFVTVVLLALSGQPHIAFLALGWLISSLIDAGILILFKRQPARRTLLCAAAANLASYLILILPAFYFGQQNPL